MAGSVTANGANFKINLFGKTTITKKSSFDVTNRIAPCSNLYGNFVKNGWGNPEYKLKGRCFQNNLAGF